MGNGSQALDMDVVFKALASEPRRAILHLLSVGVGEDKTCCDIGEVCACKLSERLGLSPSTVSHHTALLREAGLIDARKDGTWVYFSIHRDVLESVAEGLRSI